MPFQPEKLSTTQLVLLVEKRKCYALQRILEREITNRNISEEWYQITREEFIANSIIDNQKSTLTLSFW